MKKQGVPVAVQDLENTLAELKNFEEVICSLSVKPAVTLALLDSYSFYVTQAENLIQELGGNGYSSIDKSYGFIDEFLAD